MGTITINIDNDVEKQFRELAQKIYSKKKGYLGNAVTSLMKKWIDEVT